ncbi:hypothetical protein DNTS_002814 [Danionella cerebrum]|uniref:tRNA selenocysteine-associated protein 1 n=1 Tax=Danionella cerebrum TaxID=2873325 RepID=A0A553ML21_9TELE|nr:hypothetical protein DNTS_002814 [Danionella translucida]
MFNRMTSLWMGDLDPYMDENFIKQAFSTMGETAYGVKIITHRVTGGSAGYCFVEMADEASVDRCVQRLSGKLVPGSNPLHQFFLKKFPSCKGGKVVTDPYGNSRGYGFVKFSDENEQKKALEEPKTTTFTQNNSYNSSYQQQYYQQPYNSYYPQWGYDQYNSYNYGYNPYGAPPPVHGMMGPPPPMGMPPMPPDMQGSAETQEGTEEVEEDPAEDPNPEMDVEMVNKEFMERSEELYESFMDCYWQQMDCFTSEMSLLNGS